MKGDLQFMQSEQLKDHSQCDICIKLPTKVSQRLVSVISLTGKYFILKKLFTSSG